MEISLENLYVDMWAQKGKTNSAPPLLGRLIVEFPSKQFLQEACNCNSNLFTHREHLLGTLKNSLKCVRAFQIELEFGSVSF